jgi:hypothetical protein
MLLIMTIHMAGMGMGAMGASIRSQARTPVVEAVSLWETWRVFQGLWEGGDSRLSIDRQSHRLFQRDNHATAI